MATLEQEKSARDNLSQSLDVLVTMKASELARKDLEPSGLSFEAGVVFFSRTLRLFQDLHEADLADIPFQKLQQLNQVAKNTAALYTNIKNFSVTNYPSNPVGQRDQFVDQARNEYDSIFEQVAPVIAFAIRKGTDFKRLEEEAKQKLEAIDQSAAKLESTMTTTLAEAKQSLEAMQKIAQEAGVSQHALHFKAEADEATAGAKPWLITTIVLAACTIIVGIALVIRYFFVLPTLTPSQSLQLAIPKIFVFSVLLSATLWAGKMYRAYRHNAVVNRHRQNALATFEAFAKATSDEATKNAVLLQATQCIFSPQQTGYIQSEAEVATPQVLEIVRNLGK